MGSLPKLRLKEFWFLKKCMKSIKNIFWMSLGIIMFHLAYLNLICPDSASYQPPHPSTVCDVMTGNYCHMLCAHSRPIPSGSHRVTSHHHGNESCTLYHEVFLNTKEIYRWFLFNCLESVFEWSWNCHHVPNDTIVGSEELEVETKNRALRVTSLKMSEKKTYLCIKVQHITF